MIINTVNLNWLLGYCIFIKVDLLVKYITLFPFKTDDLNVTKYKV